ncbi:MAG: O-antigen ligase family protein [Rubrivivax sp.]
MTADRPPPPAAALSRSLQAASPSPIALAGAAAAGWSLYLPVGLQYLAFGALLWAAGHTLTQQQRWASWRADPMVRFTLALLAWLGLSMAWTTAPMSEAASHLVHYARLLGVPLLALGLHPALARHALKHFVIASCAAAALVVAAFALDAVSPSVERWKSWPVVGVGGNQLVAVSILLALASGLAAVQASDARGEAARRWPWALAAAVTTLGVLLQDRRTGLVLLPVLLAVVVLARVRGTAARVGATLGIVVLTGLLAMASPPLQQRLAEGWGELQAYQPGQDVNTSLGMRLRMVDVTSDMITERPWTGHGVGSWAGLWASRVQGGELLRAHTTPHNEYLLLAAQGGLPALMLGGAVLGGALLAAAGVGARRVRRPDLASLLVWITVVLAASVNAVLRDAKLALPLLLLAGWAAARARPG